MLRRACDMWPICISDAQMVRAAFLSNPRCASVHVSHSRRCLGWRTSNLACAPPRSEAGAPAQPHVFELGLEMTMSRTGLISRKYAAALAAAIAPFVVAGQAEAACVQTGTTIDCTGLNPGQGTLADTGLIYHVNPGATVAGV